MEKENEAACMECGQNEVCINMQSPKKIAH